MYQLYGIEYFKDLALNAPDIEIQRKAKRVLSIFGVNGTWPCFLYTEKCI